MHYLLLDESLVFSGNQYESLRVVAKDGCFFIQSKPFPVFDGKGKVIEDGWSDRYRSRGFLCDCISRAMEMWTGFVYDSYGAVSLKDIEERGFDVSNLTIDDVRAIARNMNDEGISEQYWHSLEYACESYGLSKIEIVDIEDIAVEGTAQLEPCDTDSLIF